MSGTSLDGVDGVLVAFDDASPTLTLRAAGHVHQPFDAALRAQLMALQSPCDGELHCAALAAHGVARAYATTTSRLLQAAGVAAVDITAVGAHGQTVRHQPGLEHGYTIQLLNGAVLAELCGIDVVCDFRSRDVAAGGQGAPLVPAFHAAVFGAAAAGRAVLNLGGMANVSLLGDDGRVTGFDTGPGGALLDGWCQRHCGLGFDAEGRWAQSGTVDAALLQALLGDPYFAAPPPKSTGRDHFDLPWVDAALAKLGRSIDIADVQATLSETTARSITGALNRHAPHTTQLIVCGGGARNADLLSRIARQSPRLAIQSSQAFGLDVDQVEAVAFAWLAQRFMLRQPGNLASVTGARGERVLGALYPA